MARTYHHSSRHNPKHRWNRPDGGMCGGMRRGEAPGWFVRFFDTRPQRFRDSVLLRAIRMDPAAADSAVWAYTGTKRPHTYYW